MVVKLGRFGKFLACTGFPRLPQYQATVKEGKIEEPAVTDEKCPNCGAPMAVKQGRFGPFWDAPAIRNAKLLKISKNPPGVKCGMQRAILRSVAANKDALFILAAAIRTANSLFGANLRANPAPNAALFSSSRPKAKSAVQAKNVNLKKNKMTKLMQSKIFLSLLTILCLFL